MRRPAALKFSYTNRAMRSRLRRKPASAAHSSARPKPRRSGWSMTLARPLDRAARILASDSGVFRSFGDEEYRDFRKQIGEQANLARAGEIDTLLDVPMLLVGQRFEVVHRQEVDVRRVVPLVREELGFRRAAGEQVGQANRPVAEVRKRHDGATADAQHFAQHF